MPTLRLQVERRSKSTAAKMAVGIFTALFSAFMVIGRLISGVHWATDIVGAVLLSQGLCGIYRFGVGLTDQRGEYTDGIQ